ncbi:MAG: hypothetical protein MI784_14455 [Cytophagales bacterium]|nr:hypothetical protein [Cytophagales bacterium]
MLLLLPPLFPAVIAVKLILLNLWKPKLEKNLPTLPLCQRTFVKTDENHPSSFGKKRRWAAHIFDFFSLFFDRIAVCIFPFRKKRQLQIFKKVKNKLSGAKLFCISAKRKATCKHCQ